MACHAARINGAAVQRADSYLVARSGVGDMDALSRTQNLHVGRSSCRNTLYSGSLLFEGHNEAVVLHSNGRSLHEVVSVGSKFCTIEGDAMNLPASGRLQIVGVLLSACCKAM